MHEWLIRPGDPAALTLAADARLSSVDYCNDQIWEMVVGRGEPPAITLQTTYGLRVRSLRIFPRFGEGDLLFSDPDEFSSPIKLQQYFPNALQLVFAPLLGINAQLTYWIPSSQIAAGRITLTNGDSSPRKVRLEWVALLAPVNTGQRMSAQEIEAVHVLTGESQGLIPVFFATGGMEATGGPYPSLSLMVELSPGTSHSFVWAVVATPEQKQSFEQARQVAARNWEAELARVELVNANQVELRIGEGGWDRALELSQTIAYSLLSGPGDSLPSPSFVINRQPDQGYSLRGDGSDYSHLWNGQSALEAYYLSWLLLPASPELVKGLVRNFLSVQRENGSIDWKPGLGGQRSSLNATPILASLAWRAYQQTQDRSFLEEVFDPLYAFFRSWFTPQNDRDLDGIPEWSQASQNGLDDHPFFAPWRPSSQGVDAGAVESPDLCAFLYRECVTLQKMASILERKEVSEGLHAPTENLNAAVNACWSEEDSCYHYWDRDTHASPGPALRLSLTWPDMLDLPVQFDQPLRLQVRLTTQDGSARRAHLYLHGNGIGGGHLVEPLAPDSFHWYAGSGRITSQRTYTSLDHVEIQGLEAGDYLELFSVNYRQLDQTLLLPLWAGMASAEQASALVQQTIMNQERFWLPYGLRTIAVDGAETDEVCQAIHLPWNLLVIEGMLAYGYRNEAAELLARLMRLTSQTWEHDGAFHIRYDAESGLGYGERNALNGLPPTGLFLYVLGIELLTPQQIIVHGFNPFPWPVTVKYRGTTVLCQKDKTTVIFADGQTTSVSEPGSYLVAMDRSGAP